VSITKIIQFVKTIAQTAMEGEDNGDGQPMKFNGTDTSSKKTGRRTSSTPHAPEGVRHQGEDRAMKLGFTGTREGMTDKQRREFTQLIAQKQPTEFHHGDCIGSDEQARNIVRDVAPKCRIVVHPPAIIELRAWTRGDLILPARPYLVRKHDIVDAVDELVATLRSGMEEVCSGSWATVRYARKCQKPITILV
jgi:hypothetical protein